MRLTLFAMLLMALLLAACTEDNNPPTILGLNSGNIQNADLNEGIQVASTFLDAWEAQDYNTMYSRLTPNARDAYPQSEFTALYQKVWDDLGLQSIAWERKQQMNSQGTTVLFEYDVSFQSASLGQFEDEGRLMRVIPTDEGMRIAWSRMDIFEGWSTGTRLLPESTLPTRGNIYDRNGEALADQNGNAVQIYLTRQQIPNEDNCINELIPLLGREYDDLRATFDQYRADSLFYVGELDQAVYQINDRVLNNACQPTQITQRSTRRYFGSAAPHVVGYVQQIPSGELEARIAEGYPADALIGAQGIERAYENELRGTIGSRLALISATDEEIDVIAEIPPSPGESVYLTLDRVLQAEIMAAFAEAYTLAEPTWAQTSRGAAAVVLDVNTGEVLAMVSYPGFDPAVFNPDNPYFNSSAIIADIQTDVRAPLLNRATQGLYPLGSVFKLASSVAAADSGIVPLEQQFPCSREWFGGQYGDSREFRTNWNTENEGIMNGQMAIVRSCNPYYWQMGVELEGFDPFLLPEYSRMMGLGVRTGIQGVQEETGRIPDPDYRSSQNQTWTIADTLNLVIGQGDSAVNPLQVARMIAVIANGGNLVTPYLVNEISLIGEEPSYVHEPQITPLDLDQQVLADVREAMCAVTANPSGTASFVYEAWYDFQNYAVIVCGKTGTAQSGGGTEPHAWFGAFAPSEDPQIAIAVVVENSCEGSEVASPIVRRIVEIYYGLPKSQWPPLWQSGCSEIVVQ